MKQKPNYIRRKGEKGRHPEEFRFAGSGRSKQGKLEPVSERHDEALDDLPRW